VAGDRSLDLPRAPVDPRRLRGVGLPGDLEEAWAIIQAGRTLISLCASEHASTAAPTRRARARQPTTVRLTPAQRRLLEALCRPLRESPYRAPASNRELADELALSLDTVKGTLTTLFERFELAELPQNQKRTVLALQALTVLSGSRSG